MGKEPLIWKKKKNAINVILLEKLAVILSVSEVPVRVIDLTW